MTRKLWAPSYLYAIFFIIILFQYGLNAHNFTSIFVDAQASDRGGSSQNQVLIQQVDYRFSTNDPTHLSGVTVNISSSQILEGQLQVSLDQGTSWHGCQYEAATTWNCSFPPGSQLSVSAVKSLQARDLH